MNMGYLKSKFSMYVILSYLPFKRYHISHLSENKSFLSAEIFKTSLCFADFEVLLTFLGASKSFDQIDH